MLTSYLVRCVSSRSAICGTADDGVMEMATSGYQMMNQFLETHRF